MTENERFVKEGQPEEMPFEVGDKVEYGGNWVFVGVVTNIRKRTVTVENVEGESKKFDYADLSEYVREEDNR